MTEKEHDPRQVVINLVASLSLADHMGDAYEDAALALEQVGVELPDDLDSYGKEPWEALGKYLGQHHAAETVWGTSMGPELDESE